MLKVIPGYGPEGSNMWETIWMGVKDSGVPIRLEIRNLSKN